MSRVMTFSRVFPSYHPKAGEPTYFVEKIWTSLNFTVSYKLICDLNPTVSVDLLWKFWMSVRQDLYYPKHHTIRAGHRWKVGDKFSPRVWSGKPYQSKQIIIAPDIEVKKVWDFDKDLLSGEFRLNGVELYPAQIQEIAKNDGLTIGQFISWFNKPFSGQIIAWSEVPNY